VIEGMKNLTQARIIELLNEVAKIEILLSTSQNLGIDEGNHEEFDQYCALLTTITLAKAKLTSLQK
jgi:hypothetical protein